MELFLFRFDGFSLFMANMKRNLNQLDAENKRLNVTILKYQSMKFPSHRPIILFDSFKIIMILTNESSNY